MWRDEEGRKIEQRVCGLAPATLASENVGDDIRSQRLTCRKNRPDCMLRTGAGAVCADCLFLLERNIQATEEPNLLQHCREIRQYVGQGTSALLFPYVAAFLVSSTGRVLDIDENSVAFLRSAHTLGIRHNRIWAPDPEFYGALLSAIARTACSAVPETLICRSGAPSYTRYTILLQPSQRANMGKPDRTRNVAALVFPLGRRRIASAMQLMSMFKLSAAEARLARSLCHGETLEEYATAQGVKLPTVKSQLRAVFMKTQTDRQVSLVSLITGIPPLR